MSRGTTTTRMRDYYDIHILMSLYESELNNDVMKEAFKETSKHRGSIDNIKNSEYEYFRMIEESEVLAKLWNQYSSKDDYVSNVQWINTLESVRKAIEKIK
ncbi:Nucleotidyl transferase AbiEii toxin, Type IV TA system [Dethiosulfatibacter aminovorans DSM 17477]|uniref:Nucleotidyl transferase AbiEii toxin, Type IV TA system n=1 Tax=Dethiosulfatibacter aminovorans DSM 17477 TaxID=1121476 RepID=A0A1M6MI89_9FIRM|nr:nucleotidyl transferase AbiEii/AbiGii toxin family protein [Dethiosulfatibacter aminovorans]SHJ83231.1 Nucleotidyl transferase AbiEii toxin, Type IV TA system [Dethiosulfatibacter aminovorans DSM 17477]